MKLFVYGTLKEGFRLHYVLKGSKKLEGQRTVNGFKLIPMPGFPAAIPDPDSSISGEVYKVIDEHVIKSLDIIEGAYNRTKVNDVFIYVLKEHNKKFSAPEWEEKILVENNVYSWII